MAEMSKAGRVYERGKPTGHDLRQKIIQDIVERGGDFITGFFDGNFNEIARISRTKYDTVKKYRSYFVKLVVSIASKDAQMVQDTYNKMTLTS